MASKTETRSDATRKAILRAAIRDFSAHGLAGARMDAIAASASVNKALLYYYFKSKTGLYNAAIEEVATATAERALAALDAKHSAGERLLRTALSHFDRILTQREFQSLMQQEMVRMRRGESGRLSSIVDTVFKPLLAKLQHAVQEGVEKGELCPVDWLQVVYSALGANVFYFLSAPMLRLLLGVDAFTPAAIENRRNSAVYYLGSALFVDRAHGARLAGRVLAEMPMPKTTHARFGERHYERA